MSLDIERDSKYEFLEFVSLLVLVTSLAAFSIDIVLPALGVIGFDLSAHEANDTQKIILLIFVGMAVGQLFYGPLSDSIGRKHALSIGVGIFVVGCCFSLVAENFQQMLFGRLLQGLGLAGTRVVSVALIRDKYEGGEMARVMSIVTAAFVIVPMIAPAVGLVILSITNWRWIFVFLLFLGLVAIFWFYFRQVETLHISRRKSFSLRGVVRLMLVIIKDPFTLSYTLALGCVSGVFIVYLSLSPQIFLRQYGLGQWVPLIFAVLALSFGVASYVNARLVLSVGTVKLSQYGLLLLTVSSMVFSVVAYFFDGEPPVFALLIYFLIMLFCTGLLLGNINSLAMERLREFAGTGAAVVGSISTIVSVCIGSIIGDA